MDEDTKDLVEASSRGLADGATRAFLSTLLGPAIQVGELAGDRIRFIRWKTQVRMLERAEAYLEARGIPANRVSMKLLLPLLELSSLEDEDEESMIDRWAALLANAAAGPERGATVLPSFPRILAELSPEEASILDATYTPADPEHVPQMFHLYPDDQRLRRSGDPLFDTRCFNLERLGLMSVSWENEHLDGDPPRYRHRVHYIEGTGLGLSFVIACTPPAG